MATIFIECPVCALGGDVAAGEAGRRATCSRCGAEFTVRGLAPAREAVEPPPRDPRRDYSERLEALGGGDGWWREPEPEDGAFAGLPVPARIAIRRLSEFRELHLRTDCEDSGDGLGAWFDVRGPLGTVAVVSEPGRGLPGELLRSFLEHPDRKLRVLDRYQARVLLELDRSWPRMEVASPLAGGGIGRVERGRNPVARTYDLSDAAGEVFARVHRPLAAPWAFSIRAPSRGQRLGEPLGALRRRWTGLGKEYFGDGDDLAIDFGDHGWTLEQRCVVLAAAVFIDIERSEAREKAIHGVVSWIGA